MNDTPTISEPPRLLEKIRNEVASELVKEFGYSSTMQVPRLEKVGESGTDKSRESVAEYANLASAAIVTL